MPDALRFAVIDPATGQETRSYEGHGPADIKRALAAASAAQPGWAALPFAARAAVLRRAAALLREDADAHARLMAAEMGKLHAEGIAEVTKCADACDFFADHAQRWLAPEPVAFDPPGEAFVTYNPLGVILAVMPWNFPFWQVIRAAAPALTAGNGMILKHASNVPGCALALEELFANAGAPSGVFSTLLIRSGPVADIIADPRIAGVTLTGSVEAGRAVAAAAGQHLKPCVLELGGSDPYIVLEDADPEIAAEILVRARMVNGGQSCIAGKRFIVVRAVAAAVEAAVARRIAAIPLGLSDDPNAKLGPMVSVQARDELHDQVEASVAQGARLLVGGVKPDHPGAWYPATLLADVKPGMTAHDEETFGPVGALIVAEDEAEAVRIANASPFGLGGGVITRDLSRGRALAVDEIASGTVAVNTNVRSDTRLPFGGVKDSGYGRELAAQGLRAFTNVKSVIIQPHESQETASTE